MSLSQDILDDIDGGEEFTGRDNTLTEWSRRAESLEAALRKYGGHLTECNRLGVLNGDCYCGWAHTMDDFFDTRHI